MYAWLAERLSGKAVRYLEFGVWDGESIREWARIVPSAESTFVGYRVVALERHPALQVSDDKVTITLEFADGSVGTVHYLANGDKGLPKERPEVFCAGKVLQLDNFRGLRGWGWQGFSKMHLWRQDKGQVACASTFVGAVKQGQPEPIPLEEILEVSRVSIELQNALRA
jgi:predicted dehydrogenase